MLGCKSDDEVRSIWFQIAALRQSRLAIPFTRKRESGSFASVKGKVVGSVLVFSGSPVLGSSAVAGPGFCLLDSSSINGEACPARALLFFSSSACSPFLPIPLASPSLDDPNKCIYIISYIRVSFIVEPMMIGIYKRDGSHGWKRLI